MKKQIIFGNDAKEQILAGAELLYKAVSATLGPKGQNAVIEAYGEPIVTHDGVTVARAIEPGDKHTKLRPGVRVGVEMIKSSSSRTNDNVGDGTTSSTILAYHLIADGLKRVQTGKNPMVLRRELEKARETALNALQSLSEPVSTQQALIEIATISSEDPYIGRQVGKMYHKLGKDAMVTVEIGTKPETEYKIIEGYSFDRGLASPLMITDGRTQTTTLEHTGVVIFNNVVGLKETKDILTEVYNSGRDNVVLIAEDFKADLVEYLFLLKDQIQVVCIKSPGFGDQRIELLKDIAALCGTKVFGNGMPDANPVLSDVGQVGKLVSSLNETILTGTQKIDDYVKELEAKREKLPNEFEKEKVDRRLAKLRAKVGNIKVGGHTEMEAEERKFLIDDAVAATEAALKDGIVPGGGTTYVEISKMIPETTDGAELLKAALLTPFKVLMENSGERYGVRLEELTEFGKGFDVLSEKVELVDLKEHGIIDPTMVIKQAITNAVSVAGSALTTGVLIVNEKEEDEEDE